VSAEKAATGTLDQGEVAWRLRHLKRSVLKETASLIDGLEADDAFERPLGAFAWAMSAPARAASLFADVPWNGHIDLLTSTSFDRPQDLWSMPAWPRGVAFASLEAPTDSGLWTMSGAVTQGQGELSSWIAAGSYRRAPAAHRYHVGLSYGVQRYLAGNTDAERNVGAIYAYDDWTLNSRLAVSYGAKHARYNYLAGRSIVSPRVDVTVMPAGRPSFKITAGVSRRAIAPGEEEFLPPQGSGLWLPPERTFSSLAPRRGFVPERVDHVEIGAEREWSGNLTVAVRGFRQQVDDQLVTLFGGVTPGMPEAPRGHYYVASAGDVDARGWGVRVSRAFTHARASVDYASIEARWVGRSPDAGALSLVAAPLPYGASDRFHDLTTSVDGAVPMTETRVLVVYKVNSRLSQPPAAGPGTGARFDLQLNQALPFLKVGGGEWEMLIAVRSLFREGLSDASVYDEILVVRPPKRMVGGVTVRF
jgi:hypothetical protein